MNHHEAKRPTPVSVSRLNSAAGTGLALWGSSTKTTRSNRAGSEVESFILFLPDALGQSLFLQGQTNGIRLGFGKEDGVFQLKDLGQGQKNPQLYRGVARLHPFDGGHRHPDHGGGFGNGFPAALAGQPQVATKPQGHGGYFVRRGKVAHI